MKRKYTMLSAAAFVTALLLTGCGMIQELSSQTPGASTDAETQTETAAESETTAEASTAAASGTTEAVSETAAPESAPDTETTAAAEQDPADFSDIAGYWYIDGDTAAASIHMSADGRFEAYYASGYLENEGTIRYEDEVIEGTTVHWYRLYGDDGEYFTGFVDDGSADKTDLYAGNGAEPHYVKLFGEGGIADDGRGPGEEFVGIWGCGRATLTIDQTSDTEFHASIWWGASAFAHVEWDYPLVYQDGKLVCEQQGTKTYVEYTDAESDPTTTVEYTDGSAEFSFKGAGIFWNDLTEHSADDMLFSNTPPEE